MITTILSGIVLGLSLALMIGPVFFTMLETSLSRGVKAAMFMALGVASSDSLYILIDYNLISYLSQNTGTSTRQFNIALGIIGGIIMFIFGFLSFIKKGKKATPTADSTISNRELIRFFTGGFVLNTINPFVFIFWIAPVSVTVNAKGGLSSDIVYFSAIIATVLSTDFLKIYLAQKLNRFLSDKMLTWLNRISGVVLMGFGIRLLFFAFNQ